MIHINIGYECGDALDCDKKNQCKYRPKFYRLHSLSVDIHWFVDYKFHIKLPYLLDIERKIERLSGTSKCPFHKSRNYTCWDCKHTCGLEKCSIPYNERKENEESEWSEYSKCGSFEKCEWADNYKSK